MARYAALLRGINVGGHHKVPMAGLKSEMGKMGFSNVVTLLNSGNVVFDAADSLGGDLEAVLTESLEKTFGFPIPVLMREAAEILGLVRQDPFKDVPLTTDTRLYVSFLKQPPATALDLPWLSDDGSFRITATAEGHVCSVLDLGVTKTPKGMDALEQLFGKNITTRNWNTLLRIAEKCRA